MGYKYDTYLGQTHKMKCPACQKKTDREGAYCKRCRRKQKETMR